MNEPIQDNNPRVATEAPESTWTHIDERGQPLGTVLREFWRSRELTWLLILRHIRIRFAQTAMGALWVLLQPLMTALIFSILFGVFVKVPSDGIPYVAFAYPAMVTWSLFAQGFERGSVSLVAEERLITKVYFLRLVIPVSATLSTLADFLISCLILLPIAWMFGVHISPRIFLSVVAIPPILMLATALGILTASLSVRYRDLRQAAPFLTQLWFYATPVVFPLSVVPASLRDVVLWNPMSAPVLWFRAAFMSTTFPPIWSLVASYGISALLLLIAIQVFRRVERGMADWL